MPNENPNENPFKGLADPHKSSEDYFKELLSKPRKPVRQGDKVLVAVGLLGHGYNWIRRECDVLAVAGTNVQLQWVDGKYTWEYWVDSALITDNLTSLRGDAPKEERK